MLPLEAGADCDTPMLLMLRDTVGGSFFLVLRGHWHWKGENLGKGCSVLFQHPEGEVLGRAFSSLASLSACFLSFPGYFILFGPAPAGIYFFLGDVLGQCFLLRRTVAPTLRAHGQVDT